MAVSDRFNFNVGDRVKDRQTGEEGRVIDIARLADGALLITVAAFVGIAIARKYQTILRPGQHSGQQIEKVVEAVTRSGSKITAPTAFTATSRSAVEQASRNQATDPDELSKFLNSIKGRTFHGQDKTIIEKARRVYNPALHDETLKKLTQVQNEVLSIHGQLSNRPGIWSRATSDITNAPHPDPQVQSLLFRKSQLIREAKQLKNELIGLRQTSSSLKYPGYGTSAARFYEFAPLKVVGEAGARGRTAARLFDTSMPEDIEGWAESVYGQLRRIKVAEDVVRRRQQQIDVALDWLVNPGRKGPNKQWSGGYLRDVILRGGKTVRPQDIHKEEALAQMLSRITITDEFVKKNAYKLPFNMGKKGTALQLLEHMRANLQGLSYAEQSELWRKQFAPTLVEAVRAGGGYARGNRALSRLQRLRADIHSQLHLMGNDPYMERLNPFLEVSDSVENRGIRIDTEVFTGVAPRGTFSGHEEFRNRYGYEVGNIDMQDLWAATHPRRRSPIGIRQVSDAQIANARNRISAINTRITPHNIFTEAGREKLIGTRQKPVNSFVSIGGVPFRVKDVALDTAEYQSRQIILQAATRNRELFAPLKFFGDEPLWNVVDQIATSQVRMSEMQGPLSSPLNIAIRGGLAGATDDLVHVPTNVLYQFMSGQEMNLSQAELSRLGFTTRAQFTEQLGFMRGQMTKALRETMPLSRLQGLAPKMVDEAEFLQEAWQFLPDILRQSQQGQYIHDVRTTAAKGAWARVEERFRDLGRDFSEAEKNLVDIFFKDEEGNLVLRESSRGMEFARSRNFREMASDRQFLTTSEYYSKVAAFERRLDVTAKSIAAQAAAGKSRVISDAEKLYTAFEKTFGRIGDEATQRNLAEELQITLQAYRRGGAAEDVAMYQQEIRDLAAQMNIELVTESPELRAMGAKWRTARKRVKRLADQMANSPAASPELQAQHAVALEHSKRVGRVYGAMKADEVASFQASTVSKRVLTGEANTLSRGNAWHRDFALIDQTNQKQASRIFNDLIALAEQEGLEGRLKPIQGAFHPMAGGKFGIVLHGNEQGQSDFIYRPLSIEGTPGGFVFSRSNPADITLFGHEPNQKFGLSQIEELVKQGNWKHVSAAEARILERNIVRSTVDATIDIESRNLPIFKLPGGQGIGVYAGKDIALETIAENTRKVFSGSQFLSVDIETSMGGKSVYNISVAHNMGLGGKFADAAELDLATPEFWAAHGMHEQAALIRQHLKEGKPLTEEMRTFVKNGQSTVIGEVVATEQEMLSRAKQFIYSRPEMPIVGHNVGFDVGILADKFGSPKMRQRMADTILAAQIAHPEATEFGLEALHRRFGGVGSDWREAHVARPDRLVMLERIKDMAMGKGVVEGLVGAEAMPLAPGQVLWDKSRGGGRAYRFEGIIDPEKAREMFTSQTGGQVNFGFGMAMRPIDFLTGEVGDIEVEYYKTPHGFARRFAAKYDITDQASAASLMDETVEDLARRRIRRITGNEKNTFGRLLMEKQRYQLAQRMAEDPTATMAELSTRYMAAATEEQKRTVGMLQRWAEKYLPDSRIRAQLGKQAEFWNQEMTQHTSIVNWLESQMNQGAVNRQQASNIWQSYMQKAQELTDWNRITKEIPEAERKLAFNIEALGANPRALRIASKEVLREDLAGLTRDIAARMAKQNPFELNRILQNLGVENTAEIFAGLRGGKTVGELLPEGVQRYLFQTHVMPAITGAEFEIAGEKRKLNIKARTMDNIINEVVDEGQSIAQQMAENVPDELKARTFDPLGLSNLQKEFTGKNATELAAQLEQDTPFRFLPRHRVGADLVNKGVREVIEQAANLAEEDQGDVIWRLRKAAQTMSIAERHKLTRILTETKPSWINEIMNGAVGRRIEAQVDSEVISDLAGTAGKAAQSFKPGMLNTAGREAAEFLTKNSAVAKKAGLFLGVGLGIYAAYNAIVPPQGPTKESSTPQREGFSSTEGEMAQRDEVVEQKSLKSKMIINIFGTDPGGIDHNELVNSVHQALGGFFGRELRHNAETIDNRSKIDKDYLDTLASRLIKGKGT